MDIISAYLTEKEILDVIEMNPMLKDIDDEDVEEMVDILKKLKCSNSTISEVIYANPFYLTNMPSSIIDIAGALINIGINDFDELLQGNPWILDKDPDDIKEFLISERKKGTPIEDIIDKIETGGML